jgi:hypothetical protein
MSSKRNDLFGKELSSFFKAAVSALEDVGEQVVHNSKAGKATIDVQLLKRQRDKALARLGELVLLQMQAGGAAPEGAAPVAAEIAQIDAQLQEARAEADKLFSVADRASSDRKSEPPKPASDRTSAPPKPASDRTPAAEADDE